MVVLASVIGAAQVVPMIIWELRTRETPWIAYHGLMFLALGVVLLVAYSFQLRGSAAIYGLLGLLAIVVWSGWKGARLARAAAGKA
jgi:hypothetical protein